MIANQKCQSPAYTAAAVLLIALLAACSLSAAPLPSLPFTSIARGIQTDGSFTPPVSLISSQQDIDALFAMQAAASSIGAEEKQHFQQAITAPYSDTVGILVGRDLSYAPDVESPGPMPKILAVQVINQAIQIVIEKPPTVTPCGMHPAWQFWKNHVCGPMSIITTGYHLVHVSRNDIPPGKYHIHVAYPDGTTVADSTAVVAPPPQP